jgi:hypothetical protein
MPGPSYATFGNTFLSKSFNFTLEPGVTPSVCYITTVPHVPTLAQDGELRLVTHDDIELVFSNCKLEAPRLDAGPGGSFWTLPILDRRWKWQFAYVKGSFNIPKPDGSYLRETDPQELAAILLSEMGESNFDVSRLPNDARPECHWEDGVRADIELDKLCSELGCIVTLNYLTDRAEIWPIGDGFGLPGGPADGSSYAPVQYASPERIRVESGDTLFQDTFECEPVGLDIDERWKPINELSYKPKHGWGWAVEGFPAIKGKYFSHGRELKIRDLAEATVYRCYRIKGLLGGIIKGSWLPTGYFNQGNEITVTDHPKSLRDFKLFDELADEEVSLADGGLRRLPAVAYVRAYQEHKETPDTPVRWPGGFSLIDSTHGILQFNDPLVRRNLPIDNTIVPATVWYECAFNCGANGIMVRRSWKRKLHDDPKTPTRVIHRPEILHWSIQRYSSSGEAVLNEDNDSDVTVLLEHWLDVAVREYTQQQGGTISYTRLMPITLDGQVVQVTWSASDRTHASTVASIAQRHNRYVPTLDQYRDRLKAKRAEQQMLTILRESPRLARI